MRPLVVVPTYNESSNVLELLARVHAALPAAEVLIVDDASPDGTADLVRADPLHGTVVHVLSRTGERGLGNAYRDGFAWALRHAYDVVVQMDADLSHPPESLPLLVGALEDADLVIGSRYVPGGATVGWPWPRKVISAAAGSYARTLLRLTQRDPTAGFKAYRTSALSAIDVMSTTTTGYGFQVECVWRAVERGLNVVEVPIVFADRSAGSSKMSLGVAVEAARRILSWRLAELRHPARWAVVAAALVTLALHLLYLRGPLLSDEGGFAMVAHWWGRGGAHLYGPQWVDRPPGLIAVFWWADHWGAYGVRLMAGVWAAGFVLAAAWAAWAVRGAVAAAWAAWAGCFLLSTPVTQTFALNGEVIAATCSMVAIAAVLHTVRRRPARTTGLLFGVLAGAAAGLGVLVKQNFLDGIAFGLALLLAQALRAPEDRPRLARVTAATGAGFALPLTIAALWAQAHAGIGALVFAMYGFRFDAAEVMARWSRAAPDERLHTLGLIAVASGSATLAVALVVAGRNRIRRYSPLLLASAVAGAVELAGVLLGGNYWAHYLIGLAPMLALAAGVLAASPERGRGLVRLFVVVPVIVVVGISPAVAVEVTQPTRMVGTAVWLREAAAPGDSVVVLYSHANLIGASGLRPAYPYSWSLPVRTLDPNLTLLVSTLDRTQDAPDWVVGWDDLHAWGLDADDQVEHALEAHYDLVATVDSHPVWLHRGESRTLPD